ncbi:putative DNA repair protein rhp42 [Glarea lozoyensis 74030]|uniref:Putative DNA repair protein rhp42 n=1 Tax=Glarea lozoyensis (strain ATCC 74030 / MF5533) TaxID=1104152 RepID=H0EIS2_GLAL7|nr:putative DNA repair protein rhp42 [Glarea lozoyensis 74030]
MPPFLPRKHLRSPSPEAGPSKRPAVGKSKPATPAARKPTLFDDLDAGTGKRRTVEDQKAILDKLVATDDEGSLSSLSSEDEFENVPGVQQKSINDGSGDEDDEIEFEDVETYTAPTQAGPAPSGDLELTLTRDTRISLTNPLGTKKGPTKIERQIRINTHQVHVQFLMFHNAIRNAWACDKELHGILLKHLSPGVEREIEKWRRRSGLSWNDQDGPEAQIKGKGKGKEVEKGKGKAKTPRGKEANPRSQRDWGQPAAMLEAGAVDISGGDPLFKLVEVLVAFWKQRFRITAPALRKLGYMPLQTLDEVTKSFEKVQHDPERYGEKIVGIEQFRVCASKMEGSRDVGAQLFTALLRAIGLDTRLVANLQPVGFGWGKYEEASEKNARQLKKPGKQRQKGDDSGHSDNSDASEEEQTEVKLTKPKTKAPARVKNTKKETPKTTRHSLRGDKGAPIDLSSSELSSLESDEESVVDVTPAKKSTKPSLPYDRDLVTPNYWSEVLSPVTNEYLPVDAIVLRLHATSQEQYERFLPPNKSERSRHITSYVVGHSSDGTAKDVTTRYLKWKKWPGRTKGYRLPPEKIPIHDRNGKIKHYEHKDWFKIVMSGYSRGSKNHPLTEVDHHEDATILQPAKPERRVVQEGKETIQYYKSSPEFVLERHLKREEALLPGAKHVKMFTTKKKGVEDSEERVFLRKDVVKCKSEETWHKEGRIPIIGVEPLKSVPYRAATINRKRQLKEQEQETGAKPLQGLYSLEQTEWIVSPPIENGHIPTNKYGNFDLFVDSMLPQGAVHLPFKGTVTICKRLGISFGEAVTDFEFGHGAAIPVVTGVVVAEEHEEAVMKEWRIYEDERQRKENEKRKRVAIGMWARMVRGLRLIKDFVAVHGEDGGHEVDEINPWTNRKTTAAEDKAIEKNRESMVHREEDLAGGFFPEGHHEEEVDQSSLRFFPGSQNPDESTGGGGFFVDEPEDPAELNSEAYATPHSLDSASRAPVQAEVQRDEKMDGRSDSDTPLPEVKKVGAKKRGRPFVTFRARGRWAFRRPRATKETSKEDTRQKSD